MRLLVKLALVIAMMLIPTTMFALYYTTDGANEGLGFMNTLIVIFLEIMCIGLLTSSNDFNEFFGFKRD